MTKVTNHEAGKSPPVKTVLACVYPNCVQYMNVGRDVVVTLVNQFS